MSEPQRLYPGASGECPHCQRVVTFVCKEEWDVTLNMDPVEHETYGESMRVGRCPGCREYLVDWYTWYTDPFTPRNEAEVRQWRRVYPEPGTTISDDVPQDLRGAYAEMRRVAAVSDQGGAVLARSLLQRALRGLGFQGPTLAAEIAAAAADPRATSFLIEQLQLVRVVGNTAAHPTDYAGMPPLNPGEFDAIAGALIELFDCFYTKPARFAAVKAAINARLVAAGRPPIP